MRRRDFISLIGGGAATWSLAARAETSSKRKLIAWLSPGTPQLSLGFADNFLRGMRDLGYVEGRDFDMVYRFTRGYQDRLPALTEELVQLKPDVILAPAVTSAVAARKVTSTIPIVVPALADAVQLGLIASEARPGGNVTELRIIEEADWQRVQEIMAGKTVAMPRRQNASRRTFLLVL